MPRQAALGLAAGDRLLAATTAELAAASVARVAAHLPAARARRALPREPRAARTSRPRSRSINCRPGLRAHPGAVAAACTESTSWSSEGRAQWDRAGRRAPTSRRCAMRSRIGEAEALLDPRVSAAFTVVEWACANVRGPANTELTRDADKFDTIDALMAKNRAVPAVARRSRPMRSWSTRRSTTRPTQDDEGFWARQAAELLALDEAWDTILDWQLAVRQVVRRRRAERHRTTASTATSRPATATGSRSTGRASRATRARSPTPTCSTRCRGSPTSLKGLGVAKGDRVNIYLPMIPEAAVAMLACARIGAPHSVVFGGFSRPVARPTASTTPRPRC